MRQEYAKTTERGLGHVHAIVITLRFMAIGYGVVGGAHQTFSCIVFHRIDSPKADCPHFLRAQRVWSLKPLLSPPNISQSHAVQQAGQDLTVSTSQVLLMLWHSYLPLPQ